MVSHLVTQSYQMVYALEHRIVRVQLVHTIQYCTGYTSFQRVQPLLDGLQQLALVGLLQHQQNGQSGFTFS